MPEWWVGLSSWDEPNVLGRIAELPESAVDGVAVVLFLRGVFRARESVADETDRDEERRVLALRFDNDVFSLHGLNSPRLSPRRGGWLSWPKSLGKIVEYPAPRPKPEVDV